jgi:hypothetical protein
MNREELIQRTYARWLEAASTLAFGAALLAFVVYASGLLPAFVPLEELPALWHLSADQYLARTGAPARWGWLELLAFSDYLSLACIALIGLVTLLCYLATLPLLLRLGERLQAALTLAQLLVLLLAASGLLAGGH